MRTEEVGRPRRVDPRSQSELVAEWDSIATLRSSQLERGLDVSYDQVLKPTIFDLINRFSEATRFLDVGCGSGALTREIASRYDSATGIDPSSKSIEIASALTSDQLATRVEWVVNTAEAYGRSTMERFQCVVANMTLMDVANLNDVAEAVSKLCEPGGCFVWTITHPFYWPRYWGYESAEWFSYAEEIFVESEFKISNEHTGLPTTHIHRPLSAYVRAMRNHGFVICDLIEPAPQGPVPSAYGERWAFPRFLAAACRREQ